MAGVHASTGRVVSRRMMPAGMCGYGAHTAYRERDDFLLCIAEDIAAEAHVTIKDIQAALRTRRQGQEQTIQAVTLPTTGGLRRRDQLAQLPFTWRSTFLRRAQWNSSKSTCKAQTMNASEALSRDESTSFTNNLFVTNFRAQGSGLCSPHSVEAQTTSAGPASCCASEKRQSQSAGRRLRC